MASKDTRRAIAGEMGTTVRMLVVLTVLTGIAYPLIVTGLGQALFPGRARGSLVIAGGREVGSSLIGQAFDGPRYFHGRPSATTPPYDAQASGGSNLGPTNPALADSVRARIATLRDGEARESGSVGRARRAAGAGVPVDLVTSSGSGLDPHLSPAAALYQVPRVARARGLDETQVRDLVLRSIEHRQFGLLGESRVNVLRLNLALDALARAH